MAKAVDISGLVFKRSAQAQSGDFSLDAITLKTLLALNGETPLGELAAQLKLDLPAISQVLKRLAEHGLIVRVDPSQKPVTSSFLPLLTSELRQATGPIAEVLLEDVLEDMNIHENRIPAGRAPDLVMELSNEIPDEQRRVAFIKKMLATLQS